MKIIKVDDVEIEYQKQNTDCDSKWCVFVKVRKKDHDKILFMIKTDHKPYTRFTIECGDITKAVPSLDELSSIEKNIHDETSKPMPNLFNDKNN